jgi:hypothetical protein
MVGLYNFEFTSDESWEKYLWNSYLIITFLSLIASSLAANMPAVFLIYLSFLKTIYLFIRIGKSFLVILFLTDL